LKRPAIAGFLHFNNVRLQQSIKMLVWGSGDEVGFLNPFTPDPKVNYQYRLHGDGGKFMAAKLIYAIPVIKLGGQHFLFLLP